MSYDKKLTILLKNFNKTQESLARELGVSFVTLNNWLYRKKEPRESNKKIINELYTKYTGVKKSGKNLLEEKRNIVLEKQKQHKGIVPLLKKRKDLFDEFVLSLTYNSNSIEGSTLTVKDTAQILFDGVTVKNKSMREHMEAKNHQAAFLRVFEHVSKKEKINEKTMLSLHQILMNSILDNAGCYRNHGVRIVGSGVVTANYLKVPELIKGLFKEKKKDILSFIPRFHADFEKIHPFSDGNGRIGRLLMVGMLLEADFPPAIIRQEKKRKYYEYLKKAQIKGDYLALEEFFLDAVIEGYALIDSE
ncbi:Fic family protein [Patescibacteria group bacterium]|nr:Fic family protein [Patescibacteria group bacterium]MBU1721235.1 Fic family protein [Patescibacteria group bacterium]MBU1901057.1 Fic family protein [Patescibacteria group bacterium]